MAEGRCSCGAGNSSFAARENICIEANRILDSCKDKDCYEDVKVLIGEEGQEIISRTGNIRVVDACIVSADISVDSIQFNRGFYSVVIRYYVKLCYEACMAPGHVRDFEGLAVIEKKVVLFGGEGSVKSFKSDIDGDGFCEKCVNLKCEKNLPVVDVEVVDPIVLQSKIIERKEHHCSCCCCCDVPDHISSTIRGGIGDHDEERILVVSLGVFSVIKIIRNGQYMINAAEFCLPEKECVIGNDADPCDIFRTMAFPVNEFCQGGQLPAPNCGKRDS